MQISSFRNSVYFLLFLITGSVFSQDLGSETVEVVKPYTPSVNDAFKIMESSKITDSVSMEKLPVQYSIFSVPVASTFVPAKGRATDLERERPIKIYDNYATLGFGNYTSILAEFYSNLEVNRTDNFGIFLTHNSAQGGIEDVIVEDKFYDTELNLNYSSRTRKMNWRTEAGVAHQLYNWYGVPEDFVPSTPEEVSQKLEQNYFSLYAGGELYLEDSFFDKAKARYRFTGDTFNSAEHILNFQPTLEIPIGGELFHTNLLVDYVGGSFERSYYYEDVINHSFLNVGLNSSLLVLRDDVTVNLGAAVYYSMDMENNDGGVYVYPKITASYRVAGEYFVAYAGLEGELKQNSYYDFMQENPFVSPTLNVRPTDEQYNLRIGAKGKLSNSIGYDIRGSYTSEDYKALFISNPEGGIFNSEDYAHGNSFGIVYDQINTLSAFGELSLDVNRNFNFRINGEYFLYDTTNEAEAWNLPDFKASVLADYQLGDNWYAGANLFFVGERKDQFFLTAAESFDGASGTVTLDSFFDINAHFGYRFNEQLSAFVRGNNLLGQNYERWMGFPVLGLQAMAGVTYKFDF